MFSVFECIPLDEPEHKDLGSVSLIDLYLVQPLDEPEHNDLGSVSLIDLYLATMNL